MKERVSQPRPEGAASGDSNLLQRDRHKQKKPCQGYINKCRNFRFLCAYHPFSILLMITFADDGVR